MTNKSFGRTGAIHSVLSYGIILSLYLFISVACNKEQGALPFSADRQPLLLGPDVSTLTRATDIAFEANDAIGLYAVKYTTGTSADLLVHTGNFADNVNFVLQNADNDWMPEYAVYFPSDDDKLDLYAYYPYRTPAFGDGTSISLNVLADQSAYSSYTRSDFMVAQRKGIGRTPQKVALTFNHKMSQMVFEIKPGAGFTSEELKKAKVKIINAITDATYDLSQAPTAMPVEGSERADIVPCGSWIENAGNLTGVKAIVVPQPVNTTTYIEVTLGSRKFVYKPAEAIQMNSGCSRTFTITLNNTRLDITTSINPWNTCPPVSGEAEEDFGEVWAGDIDSSFCGGSGTASDPYLICKGSQLAKISNDVNTGRTDYEDVYFKLANDLDMGNLLFPAIGIEREKTFCGHLDGNYHVIKNLYVKNIGRAGLFSVIRFPDINNEALSVIQNLGIEGNITGSVAGGIAGEVTHGKIENCYFKGILNGITEGNVGGIVGYMSYPTAEITNCYAIIQEANLSTEDGNSRFGGIIGYIYNTAGTFHNNYAVIEKITGHQDIEKGGVIGRIQRIYDKRPVSYATVPHDLYSCDLSLSLQSEVGISSSPEDIPANAFFLVPENDLKGASVLSNLGDAFKADNNNRNNGFPLLNWQ